MAILGKITDVVEANRYQLSVESAGDDTLAQCTGKHGRKEGEDVDVDALKGIKLSLNDFIASVRRLLVSSDLFQPSAPSSQADDSSLLPAARQDDNHNGILTHERGTAQVIVPQAPRPPQPWKANAVRGVVAVCVLAAGWVLWLSSTVEDGAGVEPAIAAELSTAADPATVLGLRPTFTPAPAATPLPAIDTSELAQIVIVTPTPDPRRAVTVAGAAIDRPLAVDGAERATLDLMGLLPLDDSAFPPQLRFDLSNVRIPPVVEEVVESPITQVEIIPIPGLAVVPAETSEPALAPEPEPLPAAVVEAGPTRAWSSFVPASPEENDHFWVQSAFLGTEYNAVAAPSYQFGSTGGGRYRPHHGLDIANPSGTPVMAGATGTVIHAGLDDPIAQGPYPNFYGNTVVIQLERKLPVASGELDVFLLYGHLSRVTVTAGQRVQPGDIVGEVGMTGIAIGPHLHVEIRVGENTYQNSVNAYLWLKPTPGEGVVAVRLITADGRSWPAARLTLARFEEGRAVWGRMIETYRDDENIAPNPAWGENGAMGDVPAGYYVLVGNVNGEAVRAEFFVRDGQTTFVEIRTAQ